MTTTTNIDIKTVTEIKKDSKLVHSLATAFATDPFFRFCLGVTEDTKNVNYSKHLKVFFEPCLRFALSKNFFIHASPDEHCVAVWCENESWRSKDRDALPMLLAIFKCFRWRSFNFLKTVEILQNSHPKEPHMYLWMLGTAPEAQGKGLGSQVLSKMLQRCDREGIPVYLESSNDQNIPFYKRHGFEVLHIIPNCPQDCPPITAMWRKPNQKASLQISSG